MESNSQPAVDGQDQAYQDPLRRRQRLLPVRYLFGDDIFISYARLDATPYAAALASSLATRGFAVRVDQWGTVPSKFVPSYLLRVVRNSSVFVLIASAAGVHSAAIQAELEAFRLTKRPIVLIDLDGSASKADWWHLVNGLHRSIEGRAAATSSIPSDGILDKISNTFTYTRKARRLRNATVWAVSALAFVSSSTVIAGTYAARKVKEARAALFLRDQATNERDQATNEAAQQRQAANGARAETVRQQALTSAAEQRMSQALNEQKHAEDDTREAIATRMISDGMRYLDSRPDVSTNLAFSAARLSSSTRAADLLEASLRRIPMWFEHVPTGANRDIFELFASDPTEHDPVATDASMSVLLTPSRAGNMDSLDLYEIPTDRKLSSMRLRNGARLETPKEGANLIAVGGYHFGKNSTGSAIFDLGGHHLEKPAITIPEAKQVAFTKGNWPVYALTSTGRLLSYGAPTTSNAAGTLIGEWPKASEISAFPEPSEAALAILEGNSLIFATINRQHTQLHKVQLEAHSVTSKCDLYWGPTSSQVLVVCSNYGSINVYGVSSANTKVKPMFSEQTSAAPLFTASDDGKRFATITGNKDSRSIVQIADVQWGESPSVHLQPEDLLASGNHRANTFGIVNCIALSPNGTALAIGTEIMGTSGTTNSVGSLEIWDLASLNQQTSVSPSSTVLNKGDRSPITRLAFSVDGNRLLSWDDSQVTTVFRIKTDTDRTIMRGLAPTEINRLHPRVDIFGAGGRFRDVKYEGGLLDHIDALTGQVSDLRLLVRSTQIYDYSMSSSSKLLTVASDRGIFKINGKHIVRQIKTPFPITNGSVADGIALIQSAHSLSVYDSESLEHLVDCPLADGFKPDWIWAQKLRSGTIWIYAVATDKSIRVRTWHFLASKAQQTTASLNQVNVNLDGLKENDAFDWFFSEGRAFFQFTAGAISESRLFVASNIKAPSEIRLYDLSTGVRLPFSSPEGLGWPTGLNSMMELIREPAGQFTVLLRYQDFKTSHTSILAATWGHDGGPCRKIVKLDAEGELIYTSGKELVGDHVVMLRSNEGLALVRTSTGKREWESTDSDFFTFPPALTLLPNNRWKAEDNVQYRKARLRVLLGGEESASQFTSVGLPPEVSRSYGNTLTKLGLSRR